MEAKKSVFVETFGESPLIKTLDFFLTFQKFDYSKSQVAEEIGISRITIDKIWERLVKSEMIVKTRIVGRAEMFKLNGESPKIKALVELDMKLSGMAARREEIALRA